ncbi:1-acyl-sn-glycerol-3-phosphate acyltransferase [Actinokineospora alba]|uniref:1-acyl-sn-glycerol-3-phosphate acyltransferase n=1 Tax=Actinokineospora alba TaxID=504798 RepID=A0A1H0QLN2_9PSEU|nr:lysophospholipid acyltransferase family protein [Actinokineospora alba]TDP70492.1 1-acyl-sn-glycerol-3-phosphate acyltransferase [Actinokineospora alba]SDI30145.1 1-acyl-sn-glycerol-3-phosphate acyltransferase [Actinokineospora alba]SDP18234.1 1-acyl-sn-glycerol-3-phosphate acyltransferase [Actinokineospora alba]
MTTDLPAGALPWLHDVGRMIGRWGFRPAFRIRVHGIDRVPRTGPVVLVANHSSMLEPQLIFGMLPRRSVFLVKQEMFRGIAGRGLRAIGQVPVKRGEPDRTPLLTAVDVLKGGGLVGVFPEGTRGEGNVAVAEQGAAWLVRSTGATLLPVATRGTHRPEGARRRFRPRIDMMVGEPFDLTVGRGRTGLIEATEQIRVRLAGLVDELDEQRKRNQ